MYFSFRNLPNLLSSQGGIYLVYLSEGNVPFFWVSFSPIFSRTEYQKKAVFLELDVKDAKRGNFVRLGYCFVQFSCCAVYFSPIFLELGII